MGKSKNRKPDGLPKPNGKRLGIFRISIDDGYVEYAYDLDVGEDNSIDSVYHIIRNTFGDRTRKGRLRAPR